jgi:hypothetical protein
MNTTQLLEIATQKLPPEILRIIASNYRRNCELKILMCSKARSVQPSYENDHECCYEINNWKYVLYKKHHDDKWHCRMFIYHKLKLMVELHHLTSTYQCDLYETIPVRILYRALVLFKRHGIFVDGKYPIQIFEKPTYKYLCAMTPIRSVLYEKRYARIWKKEEPLTITMCTVM